MDQCDHRHAVNNPQPSPCETLTRSLVDATQKSVRKQAAVLNVVETKKAECAGQVKPIESVLHDTTLDLCSPEGACNKALMKGLQAGQSASPLIRTQLESLTEQVKELTGSDLGGKEVDVNDPVISALKRMSLGWWWTTKLSRPVSVERLCELNMTRFILLKK